MGTILYPETDFSIMEQTRLYELIRRYADDKATPEEMQELHEWYRSVYAVGEVDWPAEGPGEEEQLRQRIWNDLRRKGFDSGRGNDPRSKDIGSGRGNDPRSKGIDSRRAKVRRMTGVGWKAAACLVLLAGAWLVWRYVGNRAPDQITVYNPWGKILQISLPDSSHVWLNAASTLRYTRSFGSRRELYLDGEGYFDVAEDPAHPFVVHAGGLTTTVLGTRFDMRSFDTDSGTTVTVIRGKVRVDKAEKVLDQLMPARQLQWDDRTRQSRTVSVDTAFVCAWRSGQLRFDGRLGDIAGTLSRWYNMKIVFKDIALRNCRLLGAFDNKTPLSKVLTIMSQIIDLHWTMDEKHRIVTLSGKGCQ
jgi:ferric-dicitrate binding protein FerR (iron transport regulator)